MVLKNKNNLKIKVNKLTPQEPSITNKSVGTVSTGHVVMDNSFKIASGGSVLMSNNVRVNNKDVLNPKIKNRNRETLVRTIF